MIDTSDLRGRSNGVVLLGADGEIKRDHGVVGDK